MRALEQIFCLALDVEPAGEHAFCGQAVANLLPHGVPDALEEGTDLGALVELDVFGQADAAPRAELRDLRKRVFRIDLRRLEPRTALNDDVAAADGLDAHKPDLFRAAEGAEVKRVRMLEVGGVGLGENDLHVPRRKDIADDAVSAVADAGFGERAVKHDLIALCVRSFGAEQLRRSGRAHRMGAGRTFSDLIKITNGFHGSTSLNLPVFCGCGRNTL